MMKPGRHNLLKLFVGPCSIYLSLLTLLLSNPFQANSQEASEVNLEETGIWWGVYLNFIISEKMSYYGEHHYRGRNRIDQVTSFVGRPRQIYNRAGIQYRFSDRFEVILGPTVVVNFNPDPGNEELETTIEARIWSQYLFKMQNMGRVKLVHQFRLEQRWKRSNDVGSSYDFTNRYRYKFFAYIFINEVAAGEGVWFFSPSAEIFMQSGKSVVSNPFEDFRTYNGFGYILNENITFFAGHMWTLGQKSTGFEYRTSHIFRFNVFLGFDFRKSAFKIPKINLGY